MKDKIKQKIYKEKCPYCDKVISSLSLNQMNFNYYSHIGSCKDKFMKAQAKAKSLNQNSSTITLLSGGLKTTNSKSGASNTRIPRIKEVKDLAVSKEGKSGGAL